MKKKYRRITEFADKNSRYIAGFATMQLLACLIAPESTVTAILAGFSFVLATLCVVYKLYHMIKHRALLDFNWEKHSWFMCGITLITAAWCYANDTVTSAAVFLVLAVLDFLDFLRFLFVKDK